MCLCESHIVFVHCICSLLYMPLTQILGIVVHYNKFYSILFYSILFNLNCDSSDKTCFCCSVKILKLLKLSVANLIENGQEYS